MKRPNIFRWALAGITFAALALVAFAVYWSYAVDSAEQTVRDAHDGMLQAGVMADFDLTHATYLDVANDKALTDDALREVLGRGRDPYTKDDRGLAVLSAAPELKRLSWFYNLKFLAPCAGGSGLAGSVTPERQLDMIWEAVRTGYGENGDLPLWKTGDVSDQRAFMSAVSGTLDPRAQEGLNYICLHSDEHTRANAQVILRRVQSWNMLGRK